MKNRKNLWRIIIGLIIIGWILILIGFCTGAKGGVYFNLSGMHIIENKQKEQKDLNLGEIKDIELNTSNFEIIFEEADTYGIEVKSYDDSNEISWTLENGKFKVKEETGENIRIVSLNFNFLKIQKSPYIKIYLPKNAGLNNISIISNSSNIKINNIKTEGLIINNKYGDLKLENIITNNLKTDIESGKMYSKNVTSEKIEVNNKYGSINIEETTVKTIAIQSESGNININKLKADEFIIDNKYGDIIGNDVQINTSKMIAESGKIQMKGDFIGDTEINNSYGNVKIELQKEEKYYNLDLKTKYGYIVIDDKKLKEQTEYQIKGDNNQTIKIVVKSGNINMNFKK